MPKYLYRPAGNRTPVSDPVFGALEWDGVYDDERCAADPRFQQIPDVAAEPAASSQPPADPASAADPPATRADAGKSGRS